MAWSIFREGGGAAAAVRWGEDELTLLGAPVTPEMVRFFYDWQVSEGGGGKWNPLNQGPVPGKPQLTSTGEQYGGGAADFVSYDAGLQGAYDYLHMPNYTRVLAAILAGNAAAARAALIASPWAASHYDDGRSFSNAPLPNSPLEVDLTPEQDQMLQDIHNALFNPVNAPPTAGAGIPWAVDQTLANTRAIGSHMGVPTT
jgi:hypothetical protein